MHPSKYTYSLFCFAISDSQMVLALSVARLAFAKLGFLRQGRHAVEAKSSLSSQVVFLPALFEPLFQRYGHKHI